MFRRLKFSQRVSLEDRYLFARQLHVLQRAGVPILSSLQSLEEQLPSSHLRQVLGVIYQDLTNGHTLSQAFARQSGVFDPLFIGLIRVGEQAGALDDVLKRIADLTAWEIELRSKIAQALQYPIIVVATLLVALSVMIVFVLPRFTEFFSSMKIQLPIQTRLVMGLSRLLVGYGWLLGLGLLAAGCAWWRLLRTERGKLWWHRNLLRLPIMGKLYMELLMSRFARMVSTLTASGMPILDTLALSGDSINNRYIQKGLSGVRERVKGGETLARALAADHLFPPIVLQMVRTGEETGRLDELLGSIAD